MAKRKIDTAKVFDWELAAKILAEHQPMRAAAGCGRGPGGEWFSTAGNIWGKHAPITGDTGAMVVSQTHTPHLEMDGHYQECWCRATPDQTGNDGNWPPTALALLHAETFRLGQ